MWTTSALTGGTIAGMALAIVVACGSNDGDIAITPTASPETIATPAPIVGVRGSSGLDDLVIPSFGNGGYDISHYDLDLTVDPDADTLQAVASMTVTATANLLAFNFDFAGPEVSEVSVDGVPAVFTREENELTINPVSVIPDGSPFNVRVVYGGTPAPLEIPGFPKMGWTRTLVREWIVVHGFPHALIPGNATTRDKATYSLRVTAPKPLVVSASGTLTSTIDNGDTSTYVWEIGVPVNGVHFVVSNSIRESVTGPDGLSINNYFGDDVSDITKKEFEIIAEVIELFSERFGPYPFDSYGITFVAESVGFTGFAIAGGAIIHSPNDRTIAHEIAHQWYGHSVSPAALTDNWLNEGFATYAELLWIEHSDGAAAASEAAEALRANIGSTTRPPAIAETPLDVRDGTAYVRGGLTLHALRSELGDEDFFEVMRTFSERYRYGAASTADFIAVVEEIGGRNLDEFFDDWLYAVPVPSS